MYQIKRSEQSLIIEALGVRPTIDVPAEIAGRVRFLADYLRKAKCQTYVLGISGGVDSTTAGKLAQMAVELLQGEGYACQFMAVRLPYGVQHDEAAAQDALFFIRPDMLRVIDIKPATDGMMMFMNAGNKTPAEIDFMKGNVKARQRMIAQYALAGANNGLVIGTDHAAEAVMGFFTKHGDGATDVNPLAGLTKSQVRCIAIVLGVPESLAYKVPTADLEDLAPGKPDESAFGVTYNEIDSFLMGTDICDTAAQMIIDQYNKTVHKRALPVSYV